MYNVYSFYISLILFLIFSCSKIKKDTKFSGFPKENIHNFVKITWLDGKEIKTHLKPNGAFSFDNLTKNQLAYVTLEIGNQKFPVLYDGNGILEGKLISKKGINETIDIELTNQNSVENQTFKLLEKKRTRNKAFFEKNNLYFLEEKKFDQIIDSLFIESQELTQNSKNSESYISWESQNIAYEKAAYKISYLRKQYYINDKSKINQLNKIENILTSKLILENPKMISSPSYKEFIREYFKTKLVINKKDSLQTISPKQKVKLSFSLIKSTFKSQSIIDLLYWDSIMEFLWLVNLRESMDFSEDILSTYFSEVKNQEYKSEIQNIINRWDEIKPGKNAPKFTYTDINKVEHSLKDYRGKYIYLTIWSSWCGVCVTEIEKWSELKKKYKDSNIVFLSICLDDDIDEWESWLNKTFEDQSDHLLASKGWNEQIASDYIVYKFPRFILIDPQGKIINAEARSPSDGFEEDYKILTKKAFP